MTNNYWRDRELEHIRRSIMSDEQIMVRLRQKYFEAMREIEQQIEAFYGRYASREGLTMEEARKRVTKLDIEEYARKAKRYVEFAHSDDPMIRMLAFTDRANAEMRLYNVTMKINRLELLKAHIRLELIALSSYEERLMEEVLMSSAMEEYRRQSGILGYTVTANEKYVSSIVNASFLTATWSDRLWDNHDALRHELDRLLNRGIIQGKNPRELARDLREKFDTSVYNSERLLRTELARVQQEVQKDSYEKAGFEQYEFIAEPDACPVCRNLDGKIFNVSEMEIGENAVPIHPNCRCSTAAYMDREEWDKELRSRGL